MTTTQSARTERGFWHRWNRSQAQVEAEELQDQLRGADDAALTAIDCCTPGQTVTVRGMVRSVTIRPQGNAPALEIELYDGSGSVSVVWLGRRRIPGIDAGPHDRRARPAHLQHRQPDDLQPAVRAEAVRRMTASPSEGTSEPTPRSTRRRTTDRRVRDRRRGPSGGAAPRARHRRLAGHDRLRRADAGVRRRLRRHGPGPRALGHRRRGRRAADRRLAPHPPRAAAAGAGRLRRACSSPPPSRSTRAGRRTTSCPGSCRTSATDSRS